MSDWLRASLRVAGTARSRLACGLLLLFSGTADLFADPLTAAAASQMTSDGLSLRWDNVEGAPYRVAGEVPRYRFRQDLHTVGMDPAASITLRLGGGSVLRVQFLEGRAAAEHLKVFFSEGSGLARRLRPLGSALDGTVFYQPRSLRSGFVEIAWPTAAGQRAELALFVSRIAEEPRSAFYRHLISLPTELVKLSRRSRGDLLPESDSWWRLRRNVPVVASVEGPARVRLESRLAYPPKESSSSQEYSLGVTVAGNTVRDVLATAADQNAAYEISGEVRMVGRRRVSFIDVPPGSHELQVKAEAETLVRVLTRSARDTLAHPYPFPRKDPRRVGERMHRLASEWRNSNEVSGGPLLAAMEARSLATRLAGSAAERAAAISTYFRHSRFQGVVPRDGPASRQVSARFALPLLRGPHSRVVDFYLTPEQLAGVSSLSSAVFVRVPDEEGQALVYEIPPRFAPSVLQVLVRRDSLDGNEGLYVQLGDEDPVQLFCRQLSRADASYYRPSTAEAALALRAERSGASRLYELYGSRNAARLPLPLARVGAIELPLDRTVERVRVWSRLRGPLIPPLEVALQFRDSSSVSATESEYRFLVDQASAESPGESLFRRLLRVEQMASERTTAENAMHNQWLPLLRRVREAADRFRASVAPSGAVATEPSTLAGDDEVAAAWRAASAFTRSGDWLPAFEAWTAVARGGDAELVRTAERRRIEALRALGAHYLADQSLRALIVRSEDPRTRSYAFDALLSATRERFDEAGLQELLSFELLRGGAPVVFRELAASYMRTGSPRGALQVALAAPSVERAHDLVLQAALEIGWLQAFEDSLRATPEVTTRAFWEAMRFSFRGQYEAAVRRFADAGERGRAYASALQEGLAIRAQLESSLSPDRYEALLKWEAWESRHPGPRRWQDASSLVLQHAGARWVEEPSRGRREQTYLATDHRPLRLQVLGPATLRFGLRSVHNDALASEESWVLLRWDDGELPLLHRVGPPSQAVRLYGDASEGVGRRFTAELAVPPGYREIVVSPTVGDFLVRAEVQTPEWRLNVLPTLTPQTFRSVLRGLTIPGTAIETTYRSRVRVAAGDGWSEPFPIPKLRASRLDDVPVPTDLGALLGARLALRAGDSHLLAVHAVGLRELSRSVAGVSSGERLLACRRLQEIWGRDREAEGQVTALLGGELDDDFLPGALLAHGRGREIVNLKDPVRPAGVAERLRALIYVADQTPAIRDVAQAVGARIARTPGSRVIAGLRARLLRGTTWQPLRTIDRSAGIRYVVADRWRPESPLARVRYSLVDRVAVDERMLVGDATFAVQVDSPSGRTLELLLRTRAVDQRPLDTVEVRYSLDGGYGRALATLTDGAVLRVGVDVPPGSHVVRVRQAVPLTNQYLFVGLAPGDESDGVSPVQEEVGIRRLYQIATRESPVVVPVEGPASVRVDAYVNGYSIVREHSFAAGSHELVVKPVGDESERLVRVFQRVPAEMLVSSVPREEVAVRREPRPEVPLHLETDRDREFVLHDAFRLGGQEDGTLSLRLIGRRRRLFEEDRAPGLKHEDFFELRGSHRAYAERWNTFFRTSAFGRWRDRGGPTIGIEEEIYSRPAGLPFRVNARASAIAQWPEGSGLDPGGGSEWSGLLRGGISRSWRVAQRLSHITAVSVFGRYLSLDNDLLQQPGDLDQDVFTRYKRDHLKGLVLSNTWTYTPWLDTALWARLSMTSNSALNPGRPDNFAMRIGWRQYFRGLEADGGYRVVRFFNDGDRLNAVTRDAIFLKASYDFWWQPDQRLEAGVELRHDLTVGEESGFVFLAWHFGRGRHYRDFSPRELRFRSLKKTRVPSNFNNSVVEASRE